MATRSATLIELWEKLRGYDKWVETDAQLASVATIRKRLGLKDPRTDSSRFASSLIVWKDQAGERHYGPFMAHETSPLYQLLDGETVSIRYDPRNPGKYYHRGHFLCWTVFWLKTVAAIVIGGGVIVWRFWMIFAGRG